MFFVPILLLVYRTFQFFCEVDPAEILLALQGIGAFKEQFFAVVKYYFLVALEVSVSTGVVWTDVACFDAD